MNGYNFTNAVRSVLQAARDEAISLDHEFIGTEHILLGLLRTEVGVPAAVLGALGVSVDDVRKATLDGLPRGKPGKAIGPDLPYTSRSKKVLEEAMSEARDLRDFSVGTEHLLLGLFRERKGVAAQALLGCGLTEEAVRTEIVRILESRE